MTTDRQPARPACTAPTPRRGISLPCPGCGEEEYFAVNLGHLAGDEAFTCAGCELSFSFAFLRRLVNAWSVVLPRVAALSADLSADLDDLDDVEGAVEADPI